MDRSRTRPLAAFASLLVLAACEPGTAGAGATRFLSVGTGGTGGVYYPLGGALTNRLSARDSSRQYTAEVTGGSVENVNRVRAGQIDLAFALGGTAYEAFHGGGPDYPEAVTGLRIVAPLYPNLTHVLVRGSSDIESLEGLRGTKVSVGAAGSGTEPMSRQLLEAVGLTYDDIEVRYLTFGESAAALADGAIDAAIISVGYPASAVLEAMTTGGARLLPISPEAYEALRERYPYYTLGEIPAGVYPGVDEAIPSVAMMNWLVSLDTLSEDVVANLLGILHEERDALARSHESAAQIDLGQLDDTPIPLHAAAERWWTANQGAVAAPRAPGAAP